MNKYINNRIQVSSLYHNQIMISFSNEYKLLENRLKMRTRNFKIEGLVV